MKFHVPNYSCLQIRGLLLPDPHSLSSILNWICWTPWKKFLGTPLGPIISFLSRTCCNSDLTDCLWLCHPKLLLQERKSSSCCSVRLSSATRFYFFNPHIKMRSEILQLCKPAGKIVILCVGCPKRNCTNWRKWLMNWFLIYKKKFGHSKFKTWRITKMVPMLDSS